MTPDAMTPIETFWHFVAWLGLAPWIFKSGCAAVALVYTYLLPRHWEHLPMFIGLGCIVASPYFPPAGPIGDWLVFPAMAVMIARGYYIRKPMLDAHLAAQPTPERVILEAARRTLAK